MRKLKLRWAGKFKGGKKDRKAKVKISPWFYLVAQKKRSTQTGNIKDWRK